MLKKRHIVVGSAAIALLTSNPASANTAQLLTGNNQAVNKSNTTQTAVGNVTQTGPRNFQVNNALSESWMGIGDLRCPTTNFVPSINYEYDNLAGFADGHRVSGHLAFVIPLDAGDCKKMFKKRVARSTALFCANIWSKGFHDQECEDATLEPITPEEIQARFGRFIKRNPGTVEE